jgi:hypothetical protein
MTAVPSRRLHRLGPPVSLRRSDLVLERKAGKWVEYRLADDAALASIPWGNLEKDPMVTRDRALLKELRKVPLEELCRVDLDLSRLGIRLPVRERTS